MGRYAAFRTSLGYGPESTEVPGEPPVEGAVTDGVFHPYGDDEAYHRWVVEVKDLASLERLSRGHGGREIILRTDIGGRYHGCWDLLEGGLDGIIEAYDGWRE